MYPELCESQVGRPGFPVPNEPYGLKNERKGSKGNALFPIRALSHGVNSHTLYVMLQQNPSSKLNSKPHYSSHPMDQTPKFLSFPLPSPLPPPPTPPPPPHLISFPVDLSVSMRAYYRRICLRARACMLRSKWMCILLNCILCCSMLSLFLRHAWAVKIF